MATSLVPFNQTEKFKKGEAGEQVVKKLLIKNGWYVISSYDFTGPDDNKSPRLDGIDGFFVIPDLDVCKAGRRRWIEVKTKDRANYTYKTKRLEHGIPLRHYHHYFEVQRLTGCPVWLFVYELDTKEILYSSLNALAGVVREYEGDKMSRGGMAFFPRDSFTIWRVDNFLFAKTAKQEANQ